MITTLEQLSTEIKSKNGNDSVLLLRIKIVVRKLALIICKLMKVIKYLFSRNQRIDIINFKRATPSKSEVPRSITPLF